MNYIDEEGIHGTIMTKNVMMLSKDEYNGRFMYHIWFYDVIFYLCYGNWMNFPFKHLKYVKNGMNVRA